MQIEEADVAGKIRLHAFTSSEEKIPNKILLCSFMLFFFTANMFSNMNTCINAFLGKSSSTLLQLSSKEES